ncbi:GNAT family N-acetyltransferase [Celeribacter indicus]|uniref:N-acetyltransferase domain-containing protein n=1 Tax=Celeribacter indicus TaxID=1208324 RepID=A0A0B5E230_9RHOB|nr:GNAT family N-acetyltransferase [Celeribacter indicus]AJE47106.1 hypothetical protein P73_2391 [Celeribacter indicus]SDW90703.1 Acetyltransferase (GNAT) family protein [Celeribacter indicus]
MSAVLCRRATAVEVAQMLDWAAEEGWNPGLDDAAAFRASDPEGFFVAELDGRAVAAISVVNHSDDFAFLGLYLCRPGFRGRGIGFALWTHALAHAGRRTVGLDGVAAQEANYATSGFVRAGRTRRLCGRLPAAGPHLPREPAHDPAAIARLDRAATGVARPAFLREWTWNGPTRRTVLLPGPGGIAGFATARLCRSGCKIGPVVAPTAEEAFELAVRAAAALDRRKVMIDIPDSSAGFGRLLRAREFTETFATARMYRGPAPVVGTGLQAVATLELG